MGAGESIEIPPVETLKAQYAAAQLIRDEDARKATVAREVKAHKKNLQKLTNALERFKQDRCRCVEVNLVMSNSRTKIIKDLEAAKYKVTVIDDGYERICLPE